MLELVVMHPLPLAAGVHTSSITQLPFRASRESVGHQCREAVSSLRRRQPAEVVCQQGIMTRRLSLRQV